MNTKALRGLRGAAALFVAIGHAGMVFAKVDLMGASVMGLFFLLSGFVCELTATKYVSTSDEESSSNGLNAFYAKVMTWSYIRQNESGSKDDRKPMDAGAFVNKRLGRILPAYYASIGMGIALLH